MPAPPVVLHQKLCRAEGCGELFFLCSSCDRGQRYCSQRCREKARRQQRRAANQRHQQSREGRLDHRDRQRQYRQRQARRPRNRPHCPAFSVTDQGSQPTTLAARIQAPANQSQAALLVSLPPGFSRPDPPPLRPQPATVPSPLLHCWRCGRPGRWVHLFAGEPDP